MSQIYEWLRNQSHGILEENELEAIHSEKYVNVQSNFLCFW